MKASQPLNTLEFMPDRCVNCGVCLDVCPHGVFGAGEGTIKVTRPWACMECGACARNCAAGALKVEAGVGCAAAMFKAALRGDGIERCDCDADRC
ncbi:MAG: mercury methylation ferredoxin HgcB [Chitinophagales bacterium]